MSVAPINSHQEFQMLINSGKVIIVDFWATWCGPCRFISPIFEQLAKNNPKEEVGFYKVDVDDQPDIAQEVGIRAMPTFVAFRGGEKIGELVGADQRGLTNLVQKACV